MKDINLPPAEVPAEISMMKVGIGMIRIEQALQDAGVWDLNAPRSVEQLIKQRADLKEGVKLLREALKKIQAMPEDSIWMDDRDDAADMMIDFADEALRATDKLLEGTK